MTDNGPYAATLAAMAIPDVMLAASRPNDDRRTTEGIDGPAKLRFLGAVDINDREVVAPTAPEADIGRWKLAGDLERGLDAEASRVLHHRPFTVEGYRRDTGSRVFVGSLYEGNDTHGVPAVSGRVVAARSSVVPNA